MKSHLRRRSNTQCTMLLCYHSCSVTIATYTAGQSSATYPALFPPSLALCTCKGENTTMSCKARHHVIQDSSSCHARLVIMSFKTRHHVMQGSSSCHSRLVIMSCKAHHHVMQCLSSCHSRLVIVSCKACHHVMQGPSSCHARPVIVSCKARHRVMQGPSSCHARPCPPTSLEYAHTGTPHTHTRTHTPVFD